MPMCTVSQLECVQNTSQHLKTQRKGKQRRGLDGQETRSLRQHTLICKCPEWGLAMLSDTWQSHGSVPKHRHVVYNTTDSVTDLEAPAALWLRMNVLTGTDCLPPEDSFWRLHRQSAERLFGTEPRELRARLWYNQWPHLQAWRISLLIWLLRFSSFLCAACKCYNLFRITCLSPLLPHEDSVKLPYISF